MKKLQAGLAAAILMTASVVSLADEKPVIEVYKSATCGCCSDWIKHLHDNGFTVKAHDVSNLNKYKQQADLPYGLGSCHTGFVDGYAVEGHVPASDIMRMLTEKPDIRGLAVPGMPIGSPGMEYGDRKDAYQVISYTESGQKTVFSSY